MNLVDANGEPLSTVRSGDTFGIQIILDDLRSMPLGAFKVTTDLLYDTTLINPDPTPSGDLDFNASFGADYGFLQTGSASLPGIVDEFGSVVSDFDPVFKVRVCLRPSSLLPKMFLL